jgi:DNA-binding transcriptional MerR regulator
MSLVQSNVHNIQQGDLCQKQQSLLRIDDLAHLVGMSSRTIRFYNTRRLMPAPIMRGRTAYYTQEHILILGIIRELKEQYNLSLEAIKQLLKIREQQGDVQMNLALKQRSARVFAGQHIRLTTAEFLKQACLTQEKLDELLAQELLFPYQVDDMLYFTGDDILLINLYQRLEQYGLTLALPALFRFQLRQLVRSEVAACEQYVLPQWQLAELPLEQQTSEFEKIMTLTDTLISVLHRKLLYHD